jgi:hypothetical protein
MVESLEEKLDRLQATARKKNAKRAAEEEKNKPKPPAQLPIWPEAVRAVPNSFLRSALFGVMKDGDEQMVDGLRISAQKGLSITFTGKQLTQKDLDLYEALLHVSRTLHLGNELQLSSEQLLSLQGLAKSGQNSEIQAGRMEKLRAGTLKIETEEYTYIGGVLDSALRDEETKEWRVRLNPELAKLFGEKAYTQIDFEERRALRRWSLAQWVHGFYESHAEPLPIRVETIRELCGSKTKDLHKFTTLLRRALAKVQTVMEEHDKVFEWEIRNGLLTVIRTPSKSQKKHLRKR